MTEKPPAFFPLTITLEEPVKDITAITLREPRGRDWKRWGNADEGPKRLMGLLVDLSGLEEAVFDELCMRDHARCIQAAEGFFNTYQPEDSRIMKQLLTSRSFTDGLAEKLKT